MRSISNGYVIGLATLIVLALLSTYASLLKDYVESLNVTGFNMQSIFILTRPDILAGLLIGACVLAFFTALVIQAVIAIAFEMIEEIRRQFRKDQES